MSQENVEIVRSMYEETAQGRLSTSVHLLAPQIEYARPSASAEATGLTGTWLGTEAMTRAMRDWLEPFDNFRLVGERYIEAGDAVVVLARFTCIAKASGIPIEREVGDVLTLQGGLIVRWHQYLDRAEALQAVGLAE